MKKPEITFTKNSPYLVADMDKVVSKDKAFPLRKVTSLCRCGQSKNMPYCDGSHVAAQFNGEKEEDRCGYAKKTYQGQGITVFFNPGLCAHVGICLRRLPQVFDLEKRPWINANGADKEEIIATIEKCPSGALTYSLVDGPHAINCPENSIKITKNGPYECSGQILLKDDNNTADELDAKERYCLCRCGKSKNKPLCDGQHRYFPFEE